MTKQRKLTPKRRELLKELLLPVVEGYSVKQVYSFNGDGR